MSDVAPGSACITAVFERWKREGIEFLVLRNYESLPEGIVNDIDVLIRPRQRKQARAALLAAAAECGFILHNHAAFATSAFYLHHSATLQQLHFDLFTSLKWRGFEYLDARGFLDRRIPFKHFFVPHPGDEAATNLLSYAIYTGRVKEKYKGGIAQAAAMEASHMLELLQISYGRRLALRIVQDAARSNWQGIENGVPALRRRLALRHLNRRPLWLLGSFLSDSFRLLGRLAKPPGMVIALCGPDGCGKTTLRENLSELLAPTFSPLKSRYYHWKPPAFTVSRRARRCPAPDPQGKPPRGKALSLLYFAFHWLEFVLGSHVAFRAVTFRGGLVVIDRYYYDFLVDQRRYRIQVPRNIILAAMALVKHPDLTLVLDASPEQLLARKQELPLGELKRQRDAYLAVASQLPNAVVVSAAQPAAQVARGVSALVLEYMRQRQSGPR